MKPSSARQILLAIVFVSHFLSGCSPSSPTGGDVTPQSAIDPISESEQEKFDAFLKFLLRYGSTINPTTGKVDTYYCR